MKKTDITKDEVEWLYYEEGMTQQAIADYYGVSDTKIHYVLNPEIKPSYTYMSEYYKKNKEKCNANAKDYYENNKDVCKVKNREYIREHREQITSYQLNGLQGARNKIRRHDYYNKHYQWLKRNLGRDIHIHHEWIPETDKYLFSALVDASEHLHGLINPIIILEDNRIELFREFMVHTKLKPMSSNIKKEVGMM